MHFAVRFLISAAVFHLLGGVGCYSPPPQGLRADASRKKRDNVVPTIGDPIPITGTRFLAVPFAVQVNDEGRSGLGLSPSSLGASFSFYGSSYNENPGLYQAGTAGWRGRAGLHWNNVIFIDEAAPNWSKLLFDRKVVITAAYVPDEKGDAQRGLLVAAAEADTNKDGYINKDDAVVLYHCDMAGGQLTAVTPTVGSQFRGVTFLDPEGRKLAVRTRVDSDNDGAFTAADQTVMLRVDVGGPKVFPGRPILPAEVADKAFDIVK